MWVGANTGTANTTNGGVLDADLFNKNKEVNRLLGKDPLQGLSKLGLSADWAVQVISQVGNYEEVFEKNLGMSTTLKIARGANQLYRDGGLFYIPPIK